VRVLHRADDDVGTAADVGRDGGLRPDVFPSFGVDANVDAGHLGELLRVGGPRVLVALHESLPAQDAQLRALLRRDLELGLGRRREQRGAAAERGAGRDAGSGFQEITTLDVTHHCSSSGCGHRISSNAPDWLQ
jgi:hypothetical protein